MTNFSTGLPAVDDLFTSDRPKLVLLGARPAVGKTALALQTAIHQAKQGKRVLYISLEMTEQEVWDRIRRQEFGETVSFEQNLIISDHPQVSFSRLRSLISTLEQAGAKPDLVVIDYFQLMDLDTNRSRAVAENVLSSNLKGLIREFGISILLLAQANRTVSNDVTTLPALRETESIQQDADVVLMLVAKEDREEIAVVPIKNRENSESFHPIFLIFNRERGVFVPAADTLENARYGVKRTREINTILYEVLNLEGVNRWWRNRERSIRDQESLETLRDYFDQQETDAKFFVQGLGSLA